MQCTPNVAEKNRHTSKSRKIALSILLTLVYSYKMKILARAWGFRGKSGEKKLECGPLDISPIFLRIQKKYSIIQYTKNERNAILKDSIGGLTGRAPGRSGAAGSAHGRRSSGLFYGGGIGLFGGHSRGRMYHT